MLGGQLLFAEKENLLAEKLKKGRGYYEVPKVHRNLVADGGVR